MRGYQDILLITDLDGTVVGSNNKISEKNREAVRYFKQQGGKFAVATGRTPDNGKEFVDFLEVNAPCIFYNGSALYDWQNKECLQICTLEGRVWRDFVEKSLQVCPSVCLEVFTQDAFYIVTEPEHDDLRLAKEGQRFVRVPLEQIKEEEWLKLLFCASKEELYKIRELSESFDLDVLGNSFFSAEEYYEFVSRNVSKGKMMQQIRAIPAYRKKFIFAAGDFHNDIEMLQLADCGVAPANADNIVRSAADLTGVSCDEDLLHHIIYEIMPRYFKEEK